ncbi:hypothetical protein C0993_000888 [Termitomyces sp. T159_Od127]|nr:hypothetical protein C0993_000888 [Termitomyces sp. T159_Od127]
MSSTVATCKTVEFEAEEVIVMFPDTEVVMLGKMLEAETEIEETFTDEVIVEGTVLKLEAGIEEAFTDEFVVEVWMAGAKAVPDAVSTCDTGSDDKVDALLVLVEGTGIVALVTVGVVEDRIVVDETLEISEVIGCGMPGVRECVSVVIVLEMFEV